MELTKFPALDSDTLKVVGTGFHRSPDPPKVFITMPHALEFPKLRAIWQIQYLLQRRFYPLTQTKLKGPGQWW